MNLPSHWRRCDSPETLADAAARQLAYGLVRLSEDQSRVTVALSGGRIAVPFLAALARELRARIADLSPIHWFWADERHVPLDHPDSNYRLARLHLLDPLQVPAACQHPVPTHLPPEEAARQADAALRQHAWRSPGSVPGPDVVVLGMGEDGHVASIFPGVPVELPSPTSAYGVVGRAPKPPPQRLTLTWNALRAAGQVLLLIAGAGKAAAVRRALQGELPAGQLLQLQPRTFVYLEDAALQD